MLQHGLHETGMAGRDSRLSGDLLCGEGSAGTPFPTALAKRIAEISKRQGIEGAARGGVVCAVPVFVHAPPVLIAEHGRHGRRRWHEGCVPAFACVRIQMFRHPDALVDEWPRGDRMATPIGLEQLAGEAGHLGH